MAPGRRRPPGPQPVGVGEGALTPESCTWCGTDVPSDNGFRLFEPAGGRRATFCRLEHVVPWSIRGARWEAGKRTEAASVDRASPACAQCGGELDDARLLLVRHRGEARVPDDFCSADHLLAWAKAGGRWR
jgi:hypothetical protein